VGFGYEGYISLKVGATEDVALGQGGAVPKSRQRLESSSGYGGQVKTPVSSMGIGLPFTYDWTSWEGSIEFDIYQKFLTNQIKPWIFDRDKKSKVFIQTRNNNIQEFEDSFWNNITISASEGSSVNGSIGFLAIDRTNYVRGGGFIDNKKGMETAFISGSINYPKVFGAADELLVPYWNTSILINGVLVPFTTWTLTFSQEVVPFFSCENNLTAQAPKHIGVGPMTVNFSGDYMFVDTATFLSPDKINTLTVKIKNEEIKLGDLELTTDTDALTSIDSMVPVSVEYSAYSLIA
jgi:hypothetical protein